MDFTLPKEHLILQKMYRSFAENEVKPMAQQTDEEERFPVEVVEKLKQYGFFGIVFPKEYGGQGGDYLAYAMALEEISKACATTGTIVGAHHSLCAAPIFDYGTEEQKQKYLVPLLKGETLGAFGLTEPNAGSDAAGQQTRAVLQGDHYVLNGSKIFITNAGYADTYIIMAMTDKSKGTRGISAFIVESGFPGFSIGTKEKKMGIRGSSTCEIIMEDCIVPKENLLGEEGKGFVVAMHTLDAGRISVASIALGIGEGCLEETVRYVQERKQFGRRLSAFQNTQFELADMKTKLDAAQMLVYRSARAKDMKIPYGTYSAMAKMYASEAASDVARRCVQLFGGYGFIRDYNVERMMRDAKITEIYEGTSEVQKMIISASLGVK
ncbi:MAG: acyl-CoA dehydrogenase [Clostridiales Family XIII bacterium]|jgi:butyryl-CoA dehydrogenase|nr:acyl-CoA dehydrogenase [Clostridiales Family XIII bacterium]